VLALLLLFASVAGAIPDGDTSATAPVLNGGGAIYARTCAVCHGAAGEGYAADNATALNNPRFLTTVDDSFLRRAIADGRRGTVMSAWSAAHGGPLGPADLDAVVAFIRSWERGSRPLLDESPPSGVAARAGPLFAARCASCHGDKGVGGKAPNIGGAEFLRDAGDGFIRDAIRSGREKTAMAAFGVSLSSGDIEDLLSLLRSWQAAAPPPAAAATAPGAPAGLPLNPGGPEPDGFSVYPKMTSADVVEAQLQRGAKMAILDARAPASYGEGRIAGAANVPFYDPGPMLASLPKDAWLVCYCACPHAESGQLAQKLLAAGFAKVTVIDEGLRYWRSKNYPVSAP
jgi:cytochrome c oxidase cbb3-type subunit 3/ubiquinol-cytochrome c reductase cytochrome c subunit